jgi:hypothetical protein
MPGWLLTVLVIGAVHRLTRLAVADEIPLVKVPRDWIVRRLDPPPGVHPPWGAAGRSIAYLMGCPWCMSVWVGGWVVWVTAVVHGLPVPWLVWATASSVTGLLGSWEAEHEQRWHLNDQAIAAGRAAASVANRSGAPR